MTQIKEQEEVKYVTKTITFAIIQYWQEPAGRPFYVWRPSDNYNFCPDGSFVIIGQACGHD